MSVDIKRQWLNVIRASQAACHNNNGVGIITVRILVNGNVPLHWTEPKLLKLHPKSGTGIIDILAGWDSDSGDG